MRLARRPPRRVRARPPRPGLGDAGARALVRALLARPHAHRPRRRRPLPRVVARLAAARDGLARRDRPRPPLHRSRGVGALALTGHRSAVKAVFFAPSGGAAGGNGYDAIYSLSRAGALSVWELDERVGATADAAAARRPTPAAAAAAARRRPPRRGGGGDAGGGHSKWWELQSRHYLDRGAARDGGGAPRAVGDDAAPRRRLLDRGLLTL